MTPVAFILSIIASIIATVIMIAYPKYSPSFIRRIFFKVLLKQFKGGIAYIYDNEDEAAEDILKHANNSLTVKVLGIRGFRLSSPDRKLNGLLSDKMNYEKIQITLSDPASPYAKSRSNDFVKKDFLHVEQTYEADIAHVLNTIHMCKQKNNRIELKVHEQPESFRLIITEDFLYLSFFPRGKSASLSRCYKIQNRSELYNAFVVHFNWVYDKMSIHYPKN